MRFDKKGDVVAQDFDLLKKGAGDQLGVYYQYLVTQQTGLSETLVMVNQDGTELLIAADGTITNKTKTSQKAVAPSEIVGDSISSYTYTSYLVEDLITKDGLFSITSTGCGPYVIASPTLNELTEDPEFAQLHFVALYRDSFQK